MHGCLRPGHLEHGLLADLPLHNHKALATFWRRSCKACQGLGSASAPPRTMGTLSVKHPCVYAAYILPVVSVLRKPQPYLQQPNNMAVAGSMTRHALNVAWPGGCWY